jgi:hypothetical protein
MNSQDKPSLSLNTRLPRGRALLFLASVLFALGFLPVWIGIWHPLPILSNSHAAEAFLLVSSTGLLMASFSRHLPGQNVLLASVAIALVALALHAVNSVAGIPFGPLDRSHPVLAGHGAVGVARNERHIALRHPDIRIDHVAGNGALAWPRTVRDPNRPLLVLAAA